VDGIVSNIPGKQAVFFPAMVGMLNDFPDEVDVTDTMAEYELTFIEKRVI
jgi:hypothetical protein